MTQPPVDDGDASGGHDDWAYTVGDMEALASELDILSAEARDPWDLGLRLTTAHRGAGGADSRSPLVVMAERAFAHSLADDPNRYGASVMGERFSSAMGEWPPAFDAVDPREKACWQDLATRVTHPLPKAHLNDVLLAAGTTMGRPAAEAVAAVYLELAAFDGMDPYYRASCLRRASTLTRQFSLSAESEVREALYAMAQSATSAANAPSSFLFQCLEPLAVAPRTGSFTSPDKNQVRALVEAMQRDYGQSELVLESVYGLREQLADTQDELVSARRSLIQGYLDLAQASEGLIQLHWFEQAASEAQRLGLPDMRGIAITAMQDMPVADLNMQTITTEIVFPRNLIDRRISRYRRARSALDALDIWLATAAPTGSYEANLREAANSSGRGILQFVSRMTIDAYGMPVRSTVGPEDAKTEWLERQEIFHAKAEGAALAHELSAIKTEYGLTPASDIGTHLATKYRCDLAQATAFGEALVSYWEGRHSDAARAAYPLVEAGARGLLLTLGEPLFRIETGNSEGRFPALETYAERLEAYEFDIDWLRMLRNPIATLRNSIAHGHNLRPTEVDAVILLRMAGLLVILTPANSSVADRANVAKRLREPLAYVAERANLRRRLRVVWTVGARRSSDSRPPAATRH